TVLERIFGEGGKPAITSMRELFGLVDEISEGARAAKPPLDELKGSVEGLGEAAGQAGQSGQFLNEYLEGMMPSSYNATQGINGVTAALNTYQFSTTQAGLSSQLMAETVVASMGAIASSWTGGLTGMASLAVTMWAQMLSTTVSSMTQQGSSVQSGVDRMIAATRSGWSEMVSATRAGGDGVVSAARDAASRAAGSVSRYNDEFYSAGTAMMRSLQAGIS